MPIEASATAPFTDGRWLLSHNGLVDRNPAQVSAIEGTFAARDGVYSLSHTHLAFDSMNVNGDVSLDTNPKVLTVRGHLAVDRLDLNNSALWSVFLLDGACYRGTGGVTAKMQAQISIKW